MDAELMFEKIQPGQTWRLDYGAGNLNNRLWHIRAKVDDMIVMRCWLNSGWFYKIESVYFFTENRYLTLDGAAGVEGMTE